ncbi:MAG: hypothetical protein A2516_07220 [Alphaproteobacteria bacterium RIFOXYD12_FULL_60_8]|nr:MAG: hypothetical protein A2516_07220 [Alphaproteobacteria bacterium RIFOXYD12_FULL_60_8]
MTKTSWTGTRATILTRREPSLDELYADAVLHAVLKRDRLTVEDLKRHVRMAQSGLIRKAA